MHRRKKPMRLVVDGLPSHKKAIVKKYVASTAEKLTLHFLPGYAPDLNPDELVWSHAKRTGVTRSPLRAGEKLQCRVDEQLQNIASDGTLVRFFSRHPSISYITDLRVKRFRICSVRQNHLSSSLPRLKSLFQLELEKAGQINPPGSCQCRRCDFGT